MLSAPDALLVARDPWLPGLALLLDPERLLNELRTRVPQAGLVSATAQYVRYKPATNCLVAYRVRTTSGDHHIYAKAYRSSAGDKLEKARIRLFVPDGCGIGRIVLDDHAVTVASFPNDDKLRILRTWSDGERRRKMFRRVVAGADVTAGAVEVLRYKPERRIVARVTDIGGQPAVLRGYVAAYFERSAAAAAAFQSREALLIPRCLGSSVRDAAVGVEWVSGRPLAEVIAGDEFDATSVALAGRALAELHAQRAEQLPVRTADEVNRQLAAAADAVALVHPRIAERVFRILSRIVARNSTKRLQAIHGDFYATQVILTGHAAGFLDLDEGAISDPTIDLATFLAHMEREVLAGRMSRSQMERCAEALIRGYQQLASSSSLGDLPTCLSASLLLLAPHPFRDREVAWPERIEGLVDRAAQILEPAATRASTVNESGFESRPPAGDEARVDDPYGIAADPALPYAAAALDAGIVERHFSELPRFRNLEGGVRILSIRVARYKPGRRCVIEYTIGQPTQQTTKVIAKMGHRPVDGGTCGLLESLRARGFGDESSDGVSVPEPLGIVPGLQISLQAFVRGTSATTLLGQQVDICLAQRIAEAAWKLHTCPVRLSRRHTLEEELGILGRRLQAVAAIHPTYTSRVTRVNDICQSWGSLIDHVPEAPIHRDFYPDQILVDRERLWFVDFDLCCMGDPALDAGNFLGHLIEQELRTAGDGTALEAAFDAFRKRFLELAGRERGPAVDIYTTLTLARLIWVSMRLPERRAFTETLLEACETRLGIRTAATAAFPGAML